MTESEPMIQCPKGCGNSFPLSQMYQHYESCTGKPTVNPLSVVPIWPTSSNPSIPSNVDPKLIKEGKLPIWMNDKGEVIHRELPPIAVDKPKLIKEEKITPSYCKKCGSKYIENEFYRVCSKCETIKAKARMFWWIILRYGMMIAWISLFAGFILGITSYHAVYKP